MTQIPEIKHASVIEARIVGRLVTDLLAAGLTIAVFGDGEGPDLEDTNDAEAIFAELSACSTDELTLRDASGAYAGWILLVWGNDAHVISDYTTRLEAVMAGANALADELEG